MPTIFVGQRPLSKKTEAISSALEGLGDTGYRMGQMLFQARMAAEREREGANLRLAQAAKLAGGANKLPQAALKKWEEVLQTDLPRDAEGNITIPETFDQYTEDLVRQFAQKDPEGFIKHKLGMVQPDLSPGEIKLKEDEIRTRKEISDADNVAALKRQSIATGGTITAARIGAEAELTKAMLNPKYRPSGYSIYKGKLTADPRAERKGGIPLDRADYEFYHKADMGVLEKLDKQLKISGEEGGLKKLSIEIEKASIELAHLSRKDPVVKELLDIAAKADKNTKEVIGQTLLTDIAKSNPVIGMALAGTMKSRRWLWSSVLENTLKRAADAGFEDLKAKAGQTTPMTTKGRAAIPVDQYLKQHGLSLE